MVCDVDWKKMRVHMGRSVRRLLYRSRGETTGAWTGVLVKVKTKDSRDV